MDKRDLLKKRNVIGFAMGEKITGGKKTGRPCLAVIVKKKLPLEELAKKDVVPDTVDGVETDVVESDRFRALVSRPSVRVTDTSRTGRWRPAPGGVSIGHYGMTTGTLGCLVIDVNTGKRLILSNNHVLANSNDAEQGDDILQPGPYDGGGSNDLIASLERFVELDFGEEEGNCSIAFALAQAVNFLAKIVGSSHRFRTLKTSNGINTVDAAVAFPVEDESVSDEILEVGQPNGWRKNVSVGTAVKKSGRTTGLTEDEILMTDATVTVEYDEGKSAVFEGQLIAGDMCDGGDSGSLVLDGQNRAIGLLFAGSDRYTILSPIRNVMELLDIEIPSIE